MNQEDLYLDSAFSVLIPVLLMASLILSASPDSILWLAVGLMGVSYITPEMIKRQAFQWKADMSKCN